MTRAEQEALLVQLAAEGCSVREIADRIGSSPTTVHRWMKQRRNDVERVRATLEEKLEAAAQHAWAKVIEEIPGARGKHLLEIADKATTGLARLRKAAAQEQVADAVERALTPEEITERRQATVARLAAWREARGA